MKLSPRFLVRSALVLLGLGALLGRSAGASTLDFTPSHLQGGTINGALFEEIDPTYPAGSGVIQSFVRIQATGSAGVEEGYNLDARPVQFDEKTDAVHTHTLRLADLQPVTIGGVSYYQFLLDINEPNGGTKSLLSLTQLQVFASANGDLGATGKLYDPVGKSFGALASTVYDMNAGGTGYVLLDDTNAGSGRADMVFSVPVSAFAGLDPATTYVYLFSRFGDIINGEGDFQDQGGFEEWAARVSTASPPAPTPTPVPSPTPALTLVKTGVYVPGTPASSFTTDVFGLAGRFNALIFGHFQAESGDTDDRLAVAGNTTIIGGYGVGTAVKGHPVPFAANGTTDRLVVGGNFADGDWAVNGNIVLGGARSGPARQLTNGNLLRAVHPITFDAQGNVPADGSGASFHALRAELIARSSQLGACPDRGVVQKDVSLPYRADLVGADPDFNVFNVTAEEWSRSSSSINITAPAGSTVLVNVHGRAVTIANCGMQLNGVSLENVVYNYVGTRILRTTNFAHLGSVLAPRAAAKFVAGSIDGRAVLGGCVQASNGFEFHNFLFNGTAVVPVPAVPPSIHYTFTVSNTGGVPLENVRVTDPMVAVDGSPITLAPGESDATTFTADYFPTAAEIAAGTLTNIATAVGQTSSAETVAASSTHVLTFPGSGGGSSGGAGGSSGVSPASPALDLRVAGRAVRVTTSSQATIMGTVTGATALGVVQGNAVFLPARSGSVAVDPAGARWKIRTGPLNAGRNVVKLRAASATGQSTILTLTIIKR